MHLFRAADPSIVRTGITGVIY